jgi:hypothetical protein
MLPAALVALWNTATQSPDTSKYLQFGGIRWGINWDCRIPGTYCDAEIW